MFCNKEKLFGWSEKKVVEFLGKPSFINEDEWNKTTNYDYFMNGGVQCGPGVDPKDYSGMDVALIELVFKDGKLVDMQIANSGWPNCK